MSYDTKAAHDLAEGIFRYTTRNDSAAEMIDELAYEVERLHKEKGDLQVHADRCEEAWNEAGAERNELHEEVERLQKALMAAVQGWADDH